MADLDVRYVARLARLDLTEEEVAHFQTQLGSVLGYIATLDRLNVEGLEPTVHAEESHNVTRADVPRQGLDASQALANAPAARDGLILTPRVVE